MCLLLLAALGSCRSAPAGGGGAALLDALARELRGDAGIAARLSIASEPRTCGIVRRLAFGRCRAATDSPVRSRRIIDLAARAVDAAGRGADPDALHAAALVELAWGGGSHAALRQAVSGMERAAALSPRPARVLSDLAAAYMVRADASPPGRDVVAALDAAERALRHEPGYAPARYNAALALLRLGLVEEAADAWSAYLALDSSSPWADRARRGRAASRQRASPPALPPPDAPPGALAAFAAAEPQMARRMGWCELLGAWAGAAIRESGGAPELLLRADTVAAVLARRPGGDATLHDAIRAIRSTPAGLRQKTLAEAHRRFSRGCLQRDSVAFASAEREFAAASAGAADSPVLRSWAELMRGSMLFHGGSARDGERRIRQVGSAADRFRHPALAGEAEQLLGVRMLRAQRHVDALAHAAAARDLFERAGERLNVGVALDGMASASFQLRDVDRGHALALAALEQLLPYRSSYRLHNLLSYTAEMVADDGFALAGIRLQDEGIRVAERTGNTAYVAEARLTRARLAAAAGVNRGLGADLASARAAMSGIADTTVRAWMEAQLQMVRATLATDSDPASAAAALDSAADFYLAHVASPLLALPAVVASARARLRAGDGGRAEGRLHDALMMLEERRDHIRMEPRRAAVFEEAREVVDGLTLLRLAAGDTGGALAVLDRGRASLAPAGAARRAGGRPRMTPEAVLAYALIADTLLAWTDYRGHVSFRRDIVDRARLLRAVDIAANPAAANPADLRTALSELYERLIQPLGSGVAASGVPLAVVVDGELAAVPFSALYDVRRGRYLVEDHPVRFAVSVREARRIVHREGGSGAAVIVADPAFRPVDHPALTRLPGAVAEAASVARIYPGARLLADTAARRTPTQRAMADAPVLHFAGHAVFDDARPERSFLVLAAGGAGDPATLAAREIAQMDLRNVNLVVLSACETVRTGRGRAAGYSGLAGAFLAAGAGGAVGSLWPVDDRATHPLMVEFHRAYRASGNGPESLRTAQVRMLHSRIPELRSPASWGSFRYSGQ